MNDSNQGTSIIQLIWKGLCSYALAIVVLALLMLLTFLGTLEQVEKGLYAVQQEYFNSLFLVYWIAGKVPLPLPGGYLLMTILTVNLVCGGLIRIRKNPKRPGIIITHIGILVLMVSAFVTYQYSIDGNMMLYEEERSDLFQSYHEWEIEITKHGDPDAPIYTIPQDQFSDLRHKAERRFRSDALPFVIKLSGFELNSTPTPEKSGAPVSNRIVDGFFLKHDPASASMEENISGIYADILDRNGTILHEGILWGSSRYPLTVSVDNTAYTIDLTRKKWQVPFTIVLSDFYKEDHPGTTMASKFESEVVKIENGSESKHRIVMNEPLRRNGYTFFQASWGPSNAKPGEKLYSVFAVVKNPADQWPLYSCIIVSAGMLIHFIQRLFMFLSREHRREEDQ